MGVAARATLPRRVPTTTLSPFFTLMLWRWAYVFLAERAGKSHAAPKAVGFGVNVQVFSPERRFAVRRAGSCGATTRRSRTASSSSGAFRPAAGRRRAASSVRWPGLSPQPIPRVARSWLDQRQGPLRRPGEHDWMTTQRPDQAAPQQPLRPRRHWVSSADAELAGARSTPGRSLAICVAVFAIPLVFVLLVPHPLEQPLGEKLPALPRRDDPLVPRWPVLREPPVPPSYPISAGDILSGRSCGCCLPFSITGGAPSHRCSPCCGGDAPWPLVAAQ